MEGQDHRNWKSLLFGFREANTLRQWWIELVLTPRVLSTAGNQTVTTSLSWKGGEEGGAKKKGREIITGTLSVCPKCACRVSYRSFWLVERTLGWWSLTPLLQPTWLWKGEFVVQWNPEPFRLSSSGYREMLYLLSFHLCVCLLSAVKCIGVYTWGQARAVVSLCSFPSQLHFIP